MSSKIMEALKRRRASIKGQMTKILTYAESIQPNTNYEEIKARLDGTEHLWNAFYKIEGQMVAIESEVESETDAFDETYYHAVALLSGSIRQFQSRQANIIANTGEVFIQSTALETKVPNTLDPCASVHAINTTSIISHKEPLTILPSPTNISTLNIPQNSATNNSVPNTTISTLNIPQTSSINNSSTNTTSTFNTPQTSSFNNSLSTITNSTHLLPNTTNSTLNTPAISTTIPTIPSTTSSTLKLPRPTQVIPTIQVQFENRYPPQHNTNIFDLSRPTEPDTQHSQAPLPTSLVCVTNSIGDVKPGRMLLDSESQASLVTKASIMRIALPTRKATEATVKRVTSWDSYARIKPNYHLTVQALALPNIPKSLPSASFTLKVGNYPKSRQLADPNYNQISTVDRLPKSDHLFDLITDGKKTGSAGSPICNFTEACSKRLSLPK